MVLDEQFIDSIDEEEMYQDLGLDDDQEEQRVIAETVARAKQRAAENASHMNSQLRTQLWTNHSMHDFVQSFVATFDPAAPRIYELKIQVWYLNPVLSLPYHCL
jgi:hypothetical protein